MRAYEAMFLFDPAVASSWESIEAELNRLMERIGARVILSTKWDERRLAYEIRGRKRGVYALTYFEADQNKLGDLERDVGHSEAILRCMVVRADHLTEEQMKEAAARKVEEPEYDPDRRGGRRGFSPHRDDDDGRPRRRRFQEGDEGGGRTDDRGPRGRARVPGTDSDSNDAED